MDLWPEEYEALRPEALAVTHAATAALQERLGKDAVAHPDPLVRAREQRAIYQAIEVPVPEASDETIAGVPCRVFRPDGPARGVYLHFHGGGMVLGSPRMNDGGNLALTRSHGLAVVSVDYRLAPEHPYPAGPDDGVAVAGWLIDHAGSAFGSDRLLTGGESAGGYMAAAVLLRVRDELGPEAVARFLGANLVFGVYDWGRSPSQRGLRPSDGPDILTPEGISFFADCYLPGRTDDERRDPAVSPAFADLRGLVPAIMSVGSFDHLLDDTLLLATRWRAAGNPVEMAVYPDCPHGYIGFPTELARRSAARIEAFLAARLA